MRPAHSLLYKVSLIIIIIIIIIIIAVELIQELGRRMSAVTEDTRETGFHVSATVCPWGRGNAVSFHNTFTIE